MGDRPGGHRPQSVRAPRAAGVGRSQGLLDALDPCSLPPGLSEDQGQVGSQFPVVETNVQRGAEMRRVRAPRERGLDRNRRSTRPPASRRDNAGLHHRRRSSGLKRGSLRPVEIRDSDPGMIVIQASDGTIRVD